MDKMETPRRVPCVIRHFRCELEVVVGVVGEGGTKTGISTHFRGHCTYMLHIHTTAKTTKSSEGVGGGVT